MLILGGMRVRIFGNDAWICLVNLSKAPMHQTSEPPVGMSQLLRMGMGAPRVRCSSISRILG